MWLVDDAQLIGPSQGVLEARRAQCLTGAGEESSHVPGRVAVGASCCGCRPVAGPDCERRGQPLVEGKLNPDRERRSTNGVARLGQQRCCSHDLGVASVHVPMADRVEREARPDDDRWTVEG